MRPPRLRGLPLHPLLVHFPVAAWTVATGLALAAPFAPDPSIPRLALWANGFGMVTGALAMLAGLLELTALPARRALRDAVGRHLLLASLAWLAYAAMWILQVKLLYLPAAVTAAIGFLLLVGAGHAGARVVYHHGFPPRPDSP